MSIPITHVLFESGYTERFENPRILQELSVFSSGAGIEPIVILSSSYDDQDSDLILLSRTNNRDLARREKTSEDEILIQFLKEKDRRGILSRCSDMITALKAGIQFPGEVYYCGNGGLYDVEFIQDDSLRILVLKFDCESG